MVVNFAKLPEVMNYVERLNVVVRVRKEFDADHGADHRVAVAVVELPMQRPARCPARRRCLPLRDTPTPPLSADADFLSAFLESIGAS